MPAHPTELRPDSVRVVTGWKKCSAHLAGWVVRLWIATLRIQVSPATRHRFAHDTRPTLFATWHNRLFIVTELSRQLRPARALHCLISASKDGAWLAALFESVGLRAVRGSSSRGGREAAAALVNVLREGHDVGITPDGPRGPAYCLKPGALIVARRAHCRVVLVGIDYSRAWSLRSWDRFLIPHPFSTVRLRTEEVPPEQLEGHDALPALESRLRTICPDPLATENDSCARIREWIV